METLENWPSKIHSGNFDSAAGSDGVEGGVETGGTTVTVPWAEDAQLTTVNTKIFFKAVQAYYFFLNQQTQITAISEVTFGLGITGLKLKQGYIYFEKLIRFFSFDSP